MRGRHGMPWTGREDRELALLWPEHPDPDWPGWAGALPGRDASELSRRAVEVGAATRHRALPWADDELRAVRALYPAHGAGWAGWARALPLRSRQAIAAKARELGVARHRWTPEEDEYLRGHLEAMARALGVHPAEVGRRAARLGERP